MKTIDYKTMDVSYYGDVTLTCLFHESDGEVDVELIYVNGEDITELLREDVFEYCKSEIERFY